MTSDLPNPSWPWSLDVGVSSDTGGVRSHNEDSVVADADIGLFVVADGMGGHRAGDEASAIAVQATVEYLRQARRGGESTDEMLLADAIRAANQIIGEEGSASEERAGMGSTITALVLASERFLIGHVGDSRAWRLRSGSIEQLTEDHSLVAAQLREGVISPEQAKRHPMRNVLSRSLGAADEVEVDVIPGQVVAGDVFILATDGLVHGLEAEEMAEIVASRADAQAAAEALVVRALERDDSDNTTALVVACGGPDAER